jgi:hypothetical protein
MIQVDRDTAARRDPPGLGDLEVDAELEADQRRAVSA